ncbi:Far1-related sequence like, partial [Thalictrum thalictroides]
MEGISFDTDPWTEGRRKDSGIERDCANTESSGENGINQGKKDHLPPVVGMEFNSYDDAYKFYNDYAEDMGFRIRVKSSWSRKLSREKYHAVLCCSSEGFKKQKDTYRLRPETRTGCPAVVRIRRTESQRWKVTDVVLEHNHIRIHKSNKSFGIGAKRKTPLAGNVSTETTSSLNAGSYESLTFVGTDVVNFYELALQHKYQEEAKAAFESRNFDVVLKTKCCFEQQLSKVYTREIFLKFQNEVQEMYCCFNTTQTQVDGTVATYVVKERIAGEGNNRVIKEYEVLYDSTSGDLRCICGWFFFKGYLCRHALSVLNHNGIEEIPSQYILSRWRKDVKRMFVSDHGSVYVNANNPLQRYDHLCRRVSQIVEEGVISREHYEVAMQALEDSLNKVRLVEHVKENVIDHQSNLSEHHDLIDLAQVNGMAQPSQPTLQSFVEKIYRASRKTFIDQRKKNKESEGKGGSVNQCFRPIVPKPPNLETL